jgi:hypothetical protein
MEIMIQKMRNMFGGKNAAASAALQGTSADGKNGAGH